MENPHSQWQQVGVRTFTKVRSVYLGWKSRYIPMSFDITTEIPLGRNQGYQDVLR
jgi:hypothetical protein